MGSYGRRRSPTRLGHDPNWFKQHSDIESKAQVIKVYEASLIPGLLQLPEYARELLNTGGEANVEELVAERMSRQAILDREPPPLVLVLLSKNVLRWPIGGSVVMRKQLSHLLEVSKRVNIGLRVAPSTAGAHPGLDGGFKIMSGARGDVAFTESPGGGRLVPSATEVRSYVTRYDRIGQKALPEDQSRELIVQILEALK